MNILILEVKYLKYLTIEQEYLTYLAIFSIALIWLNVYYWSRLFAKFQVYVELITKTFSNILKFMILFLVIVGLFANIIYLVDIQQEGYDWNFTEGEADLSSCLTSGGKLTDGIEPTDIEFINTFVYAYLISLGEFGIDSFRGTSHLKTVWFIFSLATFIL